MYARFGCWGAACSFRDGFLSACSRETYFRNSPQRCCQFVFSGFVVGGFQVVFLFRLSVLPLLWFIVCVARMRLLVVLFVYILYSYWISLVCALLSQGVAVWWFGECFVLFMYHVPSVILRMHFCANELSYFDVMYLSSGFVVHT